MKSIMSILSLFVMGSAYSYECMLNGVLVKDMSLKDNVEISGHLIQAMKDVKIKKSNMILYPEFFNICPDIGSDSQCRDAGFDCYLNGKCVHNGKIKEHYNSSPDKIPTALFEDLLRDSQNKDFTHTTFKINSTLMSANIELFQT